MLDDKARNKLVHTKVMGHEPNEPCTGRFVPKNPEPDGLYCTGCGADICWGDEEYHEEPIPPAYTTNMNDAWQIVEKMVARLDSYDNIGFEWMGPIYKSKLNYMSSTQHIPGQAITGHMDYTKDGGFRLGEPCWYVKYADKRYWWIMTDTPQEAICIAALRIEGVEIVP